MARSAQRTAHGAGSKGLALNVLISSAGRRSGLVAAFQRAVGPTGGLVVASDMDPLAPAVLEADQAVRVPPVTSSEFLPTLLGHAVEHGVGLVVPTIDQELRLLAGAVDDFAGAGVRALISDARLVAATEDKLDAAAFFADHGMTTPETWLPTTLPDPLPDRLFVKPRRGNASLHCYPTTPARLESVLELVPDPVIQEQLTGFEITIDALLDFEGRAIHYVPRRRIRTLGGESIQGETLPPDRYSAWVLGVLEMLGAEGAIGPLTLQAFDTDEGLILTEVNPRFGGGVPLAFAAGGDYPAWLVEMTAGRSVEPRLGEYQVGLLMTRSMREFFVEEPLWER